MADWIDRTWSETALSLLEDLDERQAIAETNPPYRSFADIKNLETLATEALRRNERFPGEHSCASAVIAVDIPKYEAILRAHTPIEAAPRTFRKLR